MMLHTKYQSSRHSGFRQEDFLMFHLENLFLACVTLICNGPEPFEQILKWSVHGSFLPSLVKIQPVVKEEMSFEPIVDEARRASNDHKQEDHEDHSGDVSTL